MRDIIRCAAVLIAANAALLAGAGVPAVVPEPSLLALTAVGLGAVIVVARKKRNR
jgi:hypothetical protein